MLVAVVDDDDAAAPPHRQARVAQQKIDEQGLGLRGCGGALSASSSLRDRLRAAPRPLGVCVAGASSKAPKSSSMSVILLLRVRKCSQELNRLSFFSEFLLAVCVVKSRSMQVPWYHGTAYRSTTVPW